MSLATYIDSALHSFLDGPNPVISADMFIKKADEARDRKEWPRAARAYKAAISAGSSRAGVKVQLGHALKEMGDFDGAERAYREFLQDNASDADIHLQLGHLFNRQENLAAALSFYEKAEKLSPENGEISLHANLARGNVGRADVIRRRNEAMALVAAEKWDDARFLLRSLVAADGEKDLIGILANVTKEAGRLDEAEALYGCYLHYAKKAGKPELVQDCNMQLGHLQKIKGEYPIALTCFLGARKLERASGEIDPEDSEAEREAVACLREIYPCFLFHS